MENIAKISHNTLISSLTKMQGLISKEDFIELVVKTLAFLTLNKKALNNTEEIIEAIQTIEQHNQEAFLNDSRNILSQFEKSVELVKCFYEFQQKGLLTLDNQRELIKALLTAQNNLMLPFNDSIYALFNQLFATAGDGELYLPFEANYHSLEFQKQQSVIAECYTPSFLQKLLPIIFKNIEYKVGDAVAQPSYIKEGKLQKFSKGFVAEPFGVRRFSVLDEVTVSRFPVGGNSQQNYLIQHLFQQVTDFAIVVVPINSLFSNVRSEEQMREWLIEQGHLKAIISLPSGIMHNTSILTAALIFDLRNKYQQVNMVNLKDSNFFEKQARELKLVDMPHLLNIIEGKEQSEIACQVDYATIAQNDYLLLPERYVLKDNVQQALATLAKYETVKLEHIANILRPETIAKLKSEGNEKVFEIQGGDLPEFGYIDSASKEITVSQAVFNELDLLKENDIIFTIRGSTGKVGIVSKALLERYNGRVIAGQISVVIRIKDVSYNPIVLLMQLRSAFAQERLQLLSSGSLVAGVSLKELKNFPIAVFSVIKQKQIEQNFFKQDEIKQQIAQQQIKMQELANEIWD